MLCSQFSYNLAWHSVLSFSVVSSPTKTGSRPRGASSSSPSRQNLNKRRQKRREELVHDSQSPKPSDSNDYISRSFAATVPARDVAQPAIVTSCRPAAVPVGSMSSVSEASPHLGVNSSHRQPWGEPGLTLLPPSGTLVNI